MINGVHAMIFAEDAEAARAFFRDVLELDMTKFRVPPGAGTTGLYQPTHRSPISE